MSRLFIYLYRAGTHALGKQTKTPASLLSAQIYFTYAIKSVIEQKKMMENVKHGVTEICFYFYNQFVVSMPYMTDLSLSNVFMIRTTCMPIYWITDLKCSKRYFKSSLQVNLFSNGYSKLT